MLKRLILCFAAVVLLFSVITSVSAQDETANILLLGTDSLGYQVSGEEEMSRADAIYVLNINQKTGAVKLLSVERDYLVTLPDGHGDNKLATATYFGGPEMCLDEVNELLDLNITMYAQIDILGMIEAVDVIGGLDVEVLEEEVEEVNVFIDSILKHRSDLTHVKKGINHLNGIEIRAFAGTRNIVIDSIESNMERNNRQQRVVKAGLDKLHEMTIDEALDVIDKVMPYIKTNITMGEIVSLVQNVQESSAKEFVYLRSPSTAFSRKRKGLHQVIVADNMDEEIKAVHSFLFD